MKLNFFTKVFIFDDLTLFQYISGSPFKFIEQIQKQKLYFLVLYPR